MVILVLGANQRAFAIDGRALEGQARQVTGTDDRHDVADHGGGRQLSHVDIRRAAEDCRVGQRQGQYPFADPAANDRHDDEKERVVKAVADQLANDQPAGNGGQGADEQGNEHPQHALDQNETAHAQNAADHQAGDHEVKEVGFFHQHFGGVDRRRSEEAVEHQDRWQHQAQDGTAADFLEDRQARAHLAEKHAHGHDDGEPADHVLGQEAQMGREINDDRDAEKDRQRDDADFVGAQAAQALHKSAVGGGFDFQGLFIGLVHVALSSCCFYRGFRNHGWPGMDCHSVDRWYPSLITQ
ncbi:hypothetical protein D3C78_486270 [compost metagenome]